LQNNDGGVIVRAARRADAGASGISKTKTQRGWQQRRRIADNQPTW
jgi:hypothetical protein